MELAGYLEGEVKGCGWGKCKCRCERANEKDTGQAAGNVTANPSTRASQPQTPQCYAV